MRFKQTTQRLGMAGEVLASIQTYGDRVAGILDAGQPEPGEGEPTFRYRMFFERLEADLRSARSGIVTAEDEHVHNLVKYANVRSRSQEVTAGLYDQQVAVRQTLGGLYGSDRGFELAAFSGRTPQYGEGLLREVDHTIRLLREPAAEAPSVRIAGVSITLADMASGLQTDRNSFQGVRVELELARKATKETRIRKNQAIAEFDRVFPWLAQALEGVFRLAGEHELADQIRTSSRRSHRRQDGEGATEETGEASAEDSAAEDSPSESEEPASLPSA